MKLKDNTFFSSHQKEHVYDPLTNAVNQDYLVKYAQNLIDHQTIFTLYLINFDNFKKINEIYSKEIADKVMVDCVNILETAINEKGIVFRYVGDSLAIITPNIAMYEEVWQIARSFMQAIRNTSFPYLKIKENFPITITTGISRFPIDAHTVDDLIQNADNALYRGKTKGKNCFIIYNKSLHGNISLNEKKANLSLPGMVNYVFAQFTSSMPYDAIKQCAHLIGNYYDVNDIILVNQDTYFLAYSKNGDADSSISYDWNYDFGFEKDETYKIFYASLLKDNTALKPLYEKMTQRKIGSVLIFKSHTENDKQLYLWIESDREKIWTDEEITIYQVINDLFLVYKKDKISL